MKYFFIFAALACMTNWTWSQTSYVPVTRVLQEKGYQLYLGADLFQSTGLINSDGTRHALTNGDSYRRYQLEVGGQYGLTKALQVGLGARLRHHESVFSDNVGDTVTATGSGIQSLATTIHYQFNPVGRLTYALEGLFRYTPYTNSEFTPGESQTKLILGDDGNEYSAGLAVTYNFLNQNSFTLRSGYRRPGVDLSGEVYWQGEGALVWKNVALVAGVDGVSSLNSDPSDNATRPLYNTGTTALYNSSNREWITPYLGMNFAMGNQWRVEFRGGQVVDGKSTDMGRFFGFQLIRRVEPSPINSVDQKFKTYDIETTIIKVSAQKNYVEIDKGVEEDIQKGMSIDFYEFDYVGGNVLVARGTVISTKAASSVVKITQRFDRKKEIKEGLVGRGSHR